MSLKPGRAPVAKHVWKNEFVRIQVLRFFANESFGYSWQTSKWFDGCVEIRLQSAPLTNRFLAGISGQYCLFLEVN